MADGSTRRVLAFSAVNEFSCTERSGRIRTSAIGVNLAPQGTQIGALNSDIFCAPANSCQTVIFAEDPDSIEKLRQSIGNLEGICIEYLKG